MRMWARSLVLILLVGCIPAAQQAPPPRLAAAAAPESVGISSERLGRLHRGMQAFVDRREAGGIVTLIGRDGKVVDVNASGFQAVEGHPAMRTDTIFRIASMSKPITSVAVSRSMCLGAWSRSRPAARSTCFCATASSSRSA